jgi:hypothetical protein
MIHDHVRTWLQLTATRVAVVEEVVLVSVVVLVVPRAEADSVVEVEAVVLAVSTDPTLKTWLRGELLCKTRYLI